MWRVHLQFILDCIKARLTGWKCKLMIIASRRVLVRCVLSALPTLALTVLKVPKKFFKEVDKRRRKFLWAQEKELTGGKCKVNWPTVCSPMDNGGLSIHDLQRFSHVLRLCWIWYAWQNPDKPQVGSVLSCDEGDYALFNAATSVTNWQWREGKFLEQFLDRFWNSENGSLYALQALTEKESFRQGCTERWHLDQRPRAWEH